MLKQMKPIVELETDKVTLEVNAPAAGTLSQIIVQEGENVEVGALLGQIGEGAAANDAQPAAVPTEAPEVVAPKQEIEEAPAPVNTSPASGATAIVVPTLGESVSEATVATWLKKEGEAVALDEPIVELETDKVTLEVNATASGVISKIIAAEGDSVEVGAQLGEISGEGSAPAAVPASAPAPVKQEAEK